MKRLSIRDIGKDTKVPAFFRRNLDYGKRLQQKKKESKKEKKQ